MPVPSHAKKVLIVDDEPSIVELLSEILTRENYSPIGVVKWTDALDTIGNQNPDLILLDLKMPTIHGSSMLEFIRSEGIDVPVIVVSGFITDEVTRELSQVGVSGFVNKPFQASQIIQQVEKVLGKASPVEAAETGGSPLPGALAAPGEDSTPAPPPEGPTPGGGLPLPDVPENVTTDVLYSQAPEQPPEPPGSSPSEGAGDESPGQPSDAGSGLPETMDALYGSSSGKPSSAASPPNTPPSDEEVLQVLQRIGQDGDGAPERGALPGGGPPERKPDTEEGTSKDILQVLKKLDSDGDGTATPEPIPGSVLPGAADPASATRPGAKSPGSSGPPGTGPVEPPPSGQIAGHQPGGSPPPSALSGPSPDASSSSRSSRRSSSHRGRRGRSRGNKNLTYMGIITVLCIIVASVLAVVKYYAQQIDIDEIASKAVKQGIEQQKAELKKELTKELSKKGR